MIFSDVQHRFFKTKLLELNDKPTKLDIISTIFDILKLLEKNNDLYYSKIKESLNLSDAKFRYVIYAMVASNFLDFKRLGKMAMFKINPNGMRLLEELEEELKDEF